MLAPYTASLQVPAWAIATPRGEYCLRATVDMPAGPVWFTSPEAAHRFLDYHADVWGPLTGARVISLPGGMAQSYEQWRAAGDVAFVDLRPCGTGIGFLDGEVILNAAA